MDTLQILCTLRDVRTFLGVFPSELLPHSLTQLSTIIVNFDPHTEESFHWPAINFQPKSFSGFYFDSYDLHPYIPSIRSFWWAHVCGTSKHLSYKVWLVRSVKITAVFSLSTCTGDVPRNISSASLTLGLPTNMSLRCSHRNPGSPAKELEAVSAPLVTVRGK